VGEGTGFGRGWSVEPAAGGCAAFRDGLREEVVLRSALRRAHGVSVRFASTPSNPAAEEQRSSEANEHRDGTSPQGGRAPTGGGGRQDAESGRGRAQPAMEQRLRAMQALVSLLERHPRDALALRGSSVLLGAPRGRGHGRERGTAGAGPGRGHPLAALAPAAGPGQRP